MRWTRADAAHSRQKSAMTYWPISSPSVFAATKHTAVERTQVSHDGIGEKHPEETPTPLAQQSNARAEQEKVSQEGNGEDDIDGVKQTKQGVAEPLAEDEIHGDIIAVRVTRSGHLFATLTRSTLTIWQTKACINVHLATLKLTST